MKQKEQLAAQEQKLEELTLKIEDVETLLDDVSDAAYDKAVEVVTDTVRQETHKEDIRLVEKRKKAAAGRKLPTKNSCTLAGWGLSLLKSRPPPRFFLKNSSADPAQLKLNRDGQLKNKPQRFFINPL